MRIRIFVISSLSFHSILVTYLLENIEVLTLHDRALILRLHDVPDKDESH